MKLKPSDRALQYSSEAAPGDQFLDVGFSIKWCVYAVVRSLWRSQVSPCDFLTAIVNRLLTVAMFPVVVSMVRH